ncbi:hypothetical protein P3X46_030772 [Hevea brasiliensis]|uniref:Uncharacterized protein n=1 Tax=Hevea brasiliensis TaxID=3981 RepID=A0ABQ9KLC3_HEVBR|nr:uncharacterized protein LOC110637667 [Hevea brasiliensis]KAJ9140085.1 hypothetical protein P3X46_030772 [Hevea brasiliensis]
MSFFPPKMANRHQRSRSTPSPSTNELCFKLKRLASRHEQMKIAYHELKSQINSGLLEAEEVFASLAIPLIKLVGLKTKEMADEGRFTTIIVDNHFSQGSRRNGVESESSDGNTRREQSYQIGKLEEESYATRAAIAGKELMEKQQTNFLQLVRLLRQIEIHVNCRQDDIFGTLDSHRVSLNKFFQKSVSHISALHSQNHDIFLMTLRLLKEIFNNVNAILGSVESGVENLIQGLAEKMCNPMVEYVMGMKDDIRNGTFVRLLAMVEEMERRIRDGTLQLEEARKKVRVAEEGKIEAICKLKTVEERVTRMNEHLSLSEVGLIKPPTSHELLGMEEEKTKDDKLLWKVLKRKRKHEATASPMGPERLLCFDTSSRHCKSAGVSLPFNHRQITKGCTRALDPRTPCLNAWIPLGLSPSVAIQPAASRKQITP